MDFAHKWSKGFKLARMFPRFYEPSVAASLETKSTGPKRVSKVNIFVTDALLYEKVVDKSIFLRCFLQTGACIYRPQSHS